MTIIINGFIIACPAFLHGLYWLPHAVNEDDIDNMLIPGTFGSGTQRVLRYPRHLLGCAAVGATVPAT